MLTEYIEMAWTDRPSNFIACKTGPSPCILRKHGGDIHAVETALIDKPESLSFSYLLLIVCPLYLQTIINNFCKN